MTASGHGGAEMSITCQPRCLHAHGPAETCRCTICGGAAHGLVPLVEVEQPGLFDEEKGTDHGILQVSAEGEGGSSGPPADEPSEQRTDAAPLVPTAAWGPECATVQPRARGRKKASADREGDAQAGRVESVGAAAWRNHGELEVGRLASGSLTAPVGEIPTSAHQLSSPPYAESAPASVTPTNQPCNERTQDRHAVADSGMPATHVCSLNQNPHIPTWRCVWAGKNARRVDV